MKKKLLAKHISLSYWHRRIKFRFFFNRDLIYSFHTFLYICVSYHSIFSDWDWEKERNGKAHRLGCRIYDAKTIKSDMCQFLRGNCKTKLFRTAFMKQMYMIVWDSNNIEHKPCAAQKCWKNRKIFFISKLKRMKQTLFIALFALLSLFGVYCSLYW